VSGSSIVRKRLSGLSQSFRENVKLNYPVVYSEFWSHKIFVCFEWLGNNSDVFTTVDCNGRQTMFFVKHILKFGSILVRFSHLTVIPNMLYDKAAQLHVQQAEVFWTLALEGGAWSTSPEDPSYYYPFIDAWVSPVVSFPQVPPQKPFTHLSPSPYALHAPPISFFSILSPDQYWVRSADHEVHYVVFSIPLIPSLSLLGPNILLNTLFSHTLSIRFSLNVSDQGSHPNKTGKIKP
jgi:hypothetical protein